MCILRHSTKYFRNPKARLYVQVWVFVVLESTNSQGKPVLRYWDAGLKGCIYADINSYKLKVCM